MIENHSTEIDESILSAEKATRKYWIELVIADDILVFKSKLIQT